MCAQSQSDYDASFRYMQELVEGEGPFAVLKGYFDESGIHKGSPVCVVCGFVLPRQSAAFLSRAWQEQVLLKYGIPFFHAKDFAKKSGPFRDWREWKFTAFAIDAMATINSALDGHSGGVVGAALLTSAFYALTIDQRRWLTGGQFSRDVRSQPIKWKRQGAPNKPYFLLFQQAILDAVKFSQIDDLHRTRNEAEVVNFFSTAKTNMRRARELYSVR